MFGSSRRGGSSRSAASSLRSGGSAHGGSNRDDAVQPLSADEPSGSFHGRDDQA